MIEQCECKDCMENQDIRPPCHGDCSDDGEFICKGCQEAVDYIEEVQFESRIARGQY